jgi:citrate lyase beta subunit
MLAKASSVAADAVVFDLEDSVPAPEKDAARDRVRSTLADWPARAPRPFVRINSPGSGQVAADTLVLAEHAGVGVVVPKVDRPAELLVVFDALGGRDRHLLVNVETPRALLQLEAFADMDGVDGLFLGGEDLTNALGMRRTADGDELAVPRFLVLTAARSAGIAAYDTICPELADLDLLERDCRTAASMGFDGKFAIHPAQIDVIHRTFRPSDHELERARALVAAFDDALARGEAAVAFDGQMVDPPVAERARAILRRTSKD